MAELRLRVQAPTREADPEITILKTLPLAWVPTVPGTEAIARSLDGSTHWHLQALGQR